MRNFDIPPVWTAGAWVTAAVVGWLVPEPAWDVRGLRLLGLGWIVVAAAFLIWSALWFRRKETPIHPGEKPIRLITEGPYRATRNPIYLSMVVATAGWVIWVGAAVGWLVVAGLWLVLNLRFAVPEEARLISTFGDEGRDYVDRVRRWI